MKNLKDIENVFFEALEYPEFARSNFFVNKQKESGWAKGIYFTALNEVYHGCTDILQYYFNAERRGKEDFKIEDVKVSIKKLAGVENENKVDKEILDDLFYSIQRAIYFDKVAVVYNSYQTITFVEVALLFIKQEFYEQTKQTVDSGFRPRTETYFIYFIAQEAPFFDFPKFKNAVRELLFTSHNLTKIEKLLISFHKLCVELVKIYNEEIYLIEQNSHADEKKSKNEIVRVEFNAETLRKSWWSDEKMFDNCKTHEVFLNQDLASYAAKIANLINEEVIQGKAVKKQIVKKNFLNDFLRATQTLSELGIANASIESIIQGNNRESPFRDYFFTAFSNLEYHCDRETLNGKNFIDLKVMPNQTDKHIVEFKGWWNSEKKSIVFQIYNYLSQFEGLGYIFMINHSKRDINKAYKNLITTDDNGYVEHSWKKLYYKTTSFSYFRSQHEIDGRKKYIYHFIFDVLFPMKVHKKTAASRVSKRDHTSCSSQNRT